MFAALAGLLAVTGLVALLWASALIPRWRRRTKGRCAACGYVRTGIAPDAPCPECGECPTNEANGRDVKLRATAWTIFLLIAWGVLPGKLGAAALRNRLLPWYCEFQFEASGWSFQIFVNQHALEGPYLDWFSMRAIPTGWGSFGGVLSEDFGPSLMLLVRSPWGQEWRREGNTIGLNLTEGCCQSEPDLMSRLRDYTSVSPLVSVSVQRGVSRPAFWFGVEPNHWLDPEAPVIYGSLADEDAGEFFDNIRSSQFTTVEPPGIPPISHHWFEIDNDGLAVAYEIPFDSRDDCGLDDDRFFGTARGFHRLTAQNRWALDWKRTQKWHIDTIPYLISKGSLLGTDDGSVVDALLADAFSRDDSQEDRFESVQTLAVEEAIRGRADRARVLIRRAWNPAWGDCDEFVQGFENVLTESEHAGALLMLQHPR